MNFNFFKKKEERYIKIFNSNIRKKNFFFQEENYNEF